jgi:hypothetical protein
MAKLIFKSANAKHESSNDCIFMAMVFWFLPIDEKAGGLVAYEVQKNESNGCFTRKSGTCKSGNALRGGAEQACAPLRLRLLIAYP